MRQWSVARTALVRWRICSLDINASPASMVLPASASVLTQRLLSTSSSSLSSASSLFETINKAKKDLSIEEVLGLEAAKNSAEIISVEMLPALKVIAESLGLMKTSPAFQNWNSTDWLMGLVVLAQHNTIQRRKRRVRPEGFAQMEQKQILDHDLRARLLKCVRMCDAVYASNMDDFCLESGCQPDTIVQSHIGGVFSPKFVLMLHHDRKEIVLVVRGSATILDFCTDVCLVNEPFQNGQGHRGMVHAATWLVQNLQDDLKKLTEENPDYTVILTGHSLGAGTAALAAMLLKPSFPKLHCYAFATPASVTEDLAIACQDYVTTVVNGDDCVPRLHQHSLLHLQEEISKFDWKATLKRIVVEEVEEQKNIVQKKKEIHLNQLHQVWQRLEELKENQKQEAKEKLHKVKRLASENISEMSSEVNKQVSASLDAVFASFKTDNKIAIERIKTLRDLIRPEKEPHLNSFWWKRIDSSVLALEKLADAVSKPEEFERILKDSKDLLLQLSLRGSGDINNAEGFSKVPPNGDHVHSRIKQIIDKTSRSIGSKITGKMSKMTEVVTSNVQDYVDSVKTLKENTKALGTTVKEEVSSMQKGLSANAESWVAEVQKLPSEVDTIVKDLKAKTADLSELYLANAHEDIDNVEYEAVHGEQVEEVSSLTTSYANEVEEMTQEPPATRELLHAPLFPPGRILYLNRKIPGATHEDKVSPEEATAAAIADEEHVELLDVQNDEFTRVVLSNRMILDHLCTAYERVLHAAKLDGESAHSLDTQGSQESKERTI